MSLSQGQSKCQGHHEPRPVQQSESVSNAGADVACCKVDVHSGVDDSLSLFLVDVLMTIHSVLTKRS